MPVFPNHKLQPPWFSTTWSCCPLAGQPNEVVERASGAFLILWQGIWVMSSKPTCFLVVFFLGPRWVFP